MQQTQWHTKNLNKATCKTSKSNAAQTPHWSISCAFVQIKGKRNKTELNFYATKYRVEIIF